NLSFAQYRADSDVVRLEAQLERIMATLAESRESALCERGETAEYRRMLRASEESARQRPSMTAEVQAALWKIKPGDVLVVAGGGGGRVAVLSTARRRGGDVRLRAITPERRLLSLGPRDFSAPPEPVGKLELPVPFAPTNGGFQRQVASALVAARIAPDRGGSPSAARAGQRTGASRRHLRGEAALAQASAAARHPVAGCPDARAHLRALDRADRLERDAERLKRRVKGRTESLARQFDRVLRVLETWGYVDGWSLTGPGHLLARLYHEADLLITECLGRGLLDGLAPAEMAALVSVFTYEPRGQAEPGAWYPSARLRQRWPAIERLAVELQHTEEEAGLPLTRRPEPGFLGLAFAWGDGEELAQVIEEEDISGGDFVRNVKQLIDLLRQIADLAERSETSHAAREAADRLFRGVVAASSVLST
ncbi:MAG: hypothetical protein ACR2NJ_12870, partial [Acidimicrobiales bacterium]